MTRKSAALLACAMAIACVSAAAAQATVETFLAEMQAELRAANRKAVAARLRYPIAVRIGGLRVPFADASSLLERYDEIFTPELIDALPKQVTVERTGDEWTITSITVPGAPAAPTPSASAPGGAAADRPNASAAAPGGATAGKPTRVGIRGGSRPTQFAGSIRPGATDVYLLWVPKGRVLEVRLTRVQGREALLRVVHAKTRAPLNPRIAGEARVVTGVAPESADYRIEVRRGEGGDSAPLPYMVSLTLR